MMRVILRFDDLCPTMKWTVWDSIEEVLDRHGRQVFRSALGVDELTWQRGKAWAMAIALMTFPYYWRTMPERCRARLAMARAVLDDCAANAPARGSIAT